jgi:hypothetical protein
LRFYSEIYKKKLPYCAATQICRVGHSARPKRTRERGAPSAPPLGHPNCLKQTAQRVRLDRPVGDALTEAAVEMNTHAMPPRGFSAQPANQWARPVEQGLIGSGGPTSEDRDKQPITPSTRRRAKAGAGDLAV